ncbi:TIGR03915 family putative DNA repair protein [Oscillospiraceae bacterium PP1C4]
MSERTDLIYTCDGSLWGVLCCVFESYTRHEVPCDILTNDDPILFPTRQIITDQENALRVYRSLDRISDEVRDWVSTGYLARTDGQEMMIFQFIRLAYRYGSRVTSMLTNKVVCDTFKAVRIVRSEAHWMREFVRFSDYGGALVAEIEPKCLTLPLMQEHFTSRFPEETFLIFDRAHGMALFYRPYEAVIQEIDELTIPSADETEQAFRALWKRYYDSIAIEGRFNPKCRMSHMPKRFWKHMTEMAPAQLEEHMSDRLTIAEQPRLKGFPIE